ncbi:MAG: alpha/beta fold hydrolase [Bacteroidales bacterium]|nr:alpha/beta fold hydrolase [Bacteroidales bacterium]
MQLFYRKLGSGPPMVILHGLYGSSDNWVSIARRLAVRYTVFIPDMRNHGESPHSHLHDYEHMCSDIEEFTTRHVGSKFILLGHSMGGKVAMTFALRHPDDLAALIVADISPLARSSEQTSIARSHEKILNALLDHEITLLPDRQSVEKRLSTETGDARVASFLMKNLRRNENGSFSWKLNAAALFSNLDKLMAGIPATEGNCQATGFPVMFIRGGFSEYLPDSHFSAISDMFPAAIFKTIEGTGHWLHAEKPDEFTDSVMKFLDGSY